MTTWWQKKKEKKNENPNEFLSYDIVVFLHWDNNKFHESLECNVSELGASCRTKRIKGSNLAVLNSEFIRF